MALSFYCRRIGSRLVPCDEAGEDDLRRLPELKIVKVSVVQERSARQLRFWWALADKVAKAMAAGGIDVDKQWVSDELCKATGHFDWVLISARECRRMGLSYGEKRQRPKPINFEQIDHWEFCRLVDRCVGFILTELLPRLPTSEFTREVERMMDDDQRAAWVEHRRGRRAA